MNTTSRLFLSTAAGFLLLANAHAGVLAVDVPRISHVGTGFIGATESIGQLHHARHGHAEVSLHRQRPDPFGPRNESPVRRPAPHDPGFSVLG